MKYIIKVYDDDRVIHTEEVEESPTEIEKVVKMISKMVGVEYLIKYEEIREV